MRPYESIPDSKKRSQQPVRVGIDIGGTFTDFVVYHPDTGRLETFKLLSTPHNPAEAVLSGLARIRVGMGVIDALEIVHGSTVATNALLERKGAVTALVTTRGFRDLLQIGRQNRPSLYDLHGNPPDALIPDHLRFEVDERVSAEGQPLIDLVAADIDGLLQQLRAQPVESVAICLLFSFLYPQHEATIADRLRSAGYFVSPSSELLPEYREYERASTTAVNAYVSPVLDRYLSHLEHELSPVGSSVPASLRVMQSNGGSLSLDEARRTGVRCILSGPAGGLVASHLVAQAAQPDGLPAVTRGRVITFDMGGTSTDVSLIAGELQVTSEAVVGGCPIRVPVLDIHTIGAGGGSIAHLDQGGALRVGPESAGANPGPACYGRGGLRVTVTDANLVLGRLAPDYFLGGDMRLDQEAAWAVLEKLGREMKVSPLAAASGVIEVANTHMERAMRVISVERGYDPRDFTLLSFGGAGGLHAANLARRMGIQQVCAPPLASTFSAFGMLASDVVKDYTHTVMLPGHTPYDDLASALESLAQPGIHSMAGDGFSPEQVQVFRYLDLRYSGQSYELTIPFTTGAQEAFHAAHLRQYGYERQDVPVEIVNLRVKLVGRIPRPRLPIEPMSAGRPSGAHAILDYKKVVLPAGEEQLPIFDANALQPGTHISGPALIIRPDTTVLVDTMDSFWVDQYKNIWVVIGYAH